MKDKLARDCVIALREAPVVPNEFQRMWLYAGPAGERAICFDVADVTSRSTDQNGLHIKFTDGVALFVPHANVAYTLRRPTDEPTTVDITPSYVGREHPI